MLCGEFVRNGTTVADIGTDHAYLPVWLCLTGKITSAVASDINPEPLKRGRLTVEKYHVAHCVELRLGSGLDHIAPEEADDIIIAGMGGELICDIIQNCRWLKDPAKHLILQPMTKPEVLTRYLYDNGFTVKQQKTCIAEKKVYTVLLAVYTGITITLDEHLYYRGKLDPKTSMTDRLFLEQQIKLLKNKAKGTSGYLSIAEKLEKSL